MISICNGDINSDDGCSKDFDWGSNQNGRGDVDDDEDDVGNDGHGVNDRDDCVNHGAAGGSDGVIGMERIPSVLLMSDKVIKRIMVNMMLLLVMLMVIGIVVMLMVEWCQYWWWCHESDADVDDDSSSDGYVNDSCGDMMMVMIVEIAMILVMMVNLGDWGPDDVYCGDNDDGVGSVD